MSATGSCHVVGSPENMAHITLFFDSKCVAHVSVNWLSPIKVRQTFIGGSKKMIVYDDLEPTEKIKVYDKGITARWLRPKMPINFGSDIGLATCGRLTSPRRRRCRPRSSTSSIACAPARNRSRVACRACV